LSAPIPDTPESGTSGRSGGRDLHLRGARLFATPDLGETGAPVDVSIRSGRIEAVGANLPRPDPAVEILDAGGLTLIPGLVDVHVHFRDPGLEHIEGWDRGSLGALHGGVTSVVEVQNNPPLSVDGAALDARIAHVRQRSRVDFGCLGNLLPDSVPSLGEMAPRTPAFKLFMGGSTGVGGVTERGVMRDLFRAAALAGRRVVTHCEDEGLLREGRRAYPDATATEHHLVRSSEAEIESVRTAVELAAETGAGLHIFHLSTRGGVEIVRAARAAGQPLWASTAPHYLLLSCEDTAELGNFAKVNPSIKTRDDSAALLEALVDGTLDAIGTDHAPHPLESKRRDYSHAPSGIPSVDLLWPLTLELVRRGLLDAPTALASVTARAAESLGLHGKGALAPGFDADLVLFDPEEERPVVGAELPSTSRWSPYEGMGLAGFPRMVLRRGELVWRDGKSLADAGGELLALGPLTPAS